MRGARFAFALTLALQPLLAGAADIAITDVTLIDGNGGAVQRGVDVLIDAGLIDTIGVDLTIPEGVYRIDGNGKYLLPGFIDSNVHATIYGNASRRETVVKYGDHNEKLALEFAQRQLKYGVTTVRDSYGALEPLIAVRDRIEAGAAIGARMLVAGNIVGWGGPFSLTFSLIPESELTLFQARWNDHIAQGVGEELMDMGPEEVRGAINRYLDKGPDFIKYGGTSHFLQPSLITFSPRVQKVVVDETHKRELRAETHATSPEALRIAVEAGIDLIQHPEILTREYPEELLDLIIGNDVVCALRSNTLTGSAWRKHLAKREQVERELAGTPPPRTLAEARDRERRRGTGYALQRKNAETLIRRGCRVSIATDNYQGRAPEFRREAKSEVHEAGIGSILAIEGLVELGMSEMDAIVAATRNGAIAAGMLDRIGTVEEGKIADLVLLAANPLDDIANIRKLDDVIARGKRVDVATLPEQVLFYTGDLPRGASRTEIDNAVPRERAVAGPGIPAGDGCGTADTALTRYGIVNLRAARSSGQVAGIK
ncbi:MAG: amidohydrolase family protein, partial [Pseudomonadota bacterium]